MTNLFCLRFTSDIKKLRNLCKEFQCVVLSIETMYDLESEHMLLIDWFTEFQINVIASSHLASGFQSFSQTLHKKKHLIDI
jgi:hypothetical protein